MTKPTKGFTLVELLISLAVLAILLFVAVPSSVIFVSDAQVDSTRERLLSALSLARSEAVKRGARVIICRKQASVENCAGISTTAVNRAWSDGWLVFADEDSDNALDSGELLRVQDDLFDTITVSFSRGDAIIFTAMGVLETNSTGDELFVIATDSSSDSGSGLTIRPTGRVRRCSDWNVGAGICNDS